MSFHTDMKDAAELVQDWRGSLCLEAEADGFREFAELLEHLDLSGAPESMLEGTVQLVVAAGAYRSMDVLNARRHPTEQALSHHVRVFYSGGTGDHRADNAILEHIAFSLQSSASTPICLVTKDGDFARQAGAKGGTIMDPEEFATLLEITAD